MTSRQADEALVGGRTGASRGGGTLSALPESIIHGEAGRRWSARAAPPSDRCARGSLSAPRLNDLGEGSGPIDNDRITSPFTDCQVQEQVGGCPSTRLGLGPFHPHPRPSRQSLTLADPNPVPLIPKQLFTIIGSWCFLRVEY